jgi:peptidoglycan/LPS O-acetylase OafA/YrhL
MSRNGSRNYELDFLRLLAAIIVVAFHVTFGNYVLHFNPVRYPTFVTEVARYGNIGVPVFFFISGLVILNSAASGSARRFAVSRMVRLYPAYWACVTITFLVLTVAGTRHVAVSDYLVNLTMLEGFVGRPLVDAVYWTLQVELIFYAIVWLTLLTGQMRRMTQVLWAWLAVAGLLTALQVAGATVPNRVVVATGYAPYFVMGAAVALYLQGSEGPTGRRVRTLLIAASGLSLLRAYFDAKADKVIYPSIDLRISMVVFVVAMALAVAVGFGRLRRFGRPWMVAAGLLTYPLYLLHDEVSNVLFTRWHAMNRWLLLALVLAMVAVASWGVHILVENPVAPRLRRVLNDGWDRVLTWRAPRPVAEPAGAPEVPGAAPPG